MILDHIGVAVRDFGKSSTFYRRALAPLGIETVLEGEGWTMLGKDGRPEFWFGLHGIPPGPIHIAFAVPLNILIVIGTLEIGSSLVVIVSVPLNTIVAFPSIDAFVSVRLCMVWLCATYPSTLTIEILATKLADGRSDSTGPTLRRRTQNPDSIHSGFR